MARYWDLLAEYDAVTDTYTEAAGGTKASPYSPLLNGKLVGLRAIANRDSAASLVDHIQFKLSCATFKPNAFTIGLQGSGLQTAPALQSGHAAQQDYDVDQAVQVGSQITIEARNVGADTQVTVSALLYGCFEG
jgi:hypothetical protein